MTTTIETRQIICEQNKNRYSKITLSQLILIATAAFLCLLTIGCVNKSKSFEEILTLHEIYIDDRDIGKSGNIYLVFQITNDKKEEYFSLNKSGDLQPWNLNLESISVARNVISFKDKEVLNVPVSTLPKGDYRVIPAYCAESCTEFIYAGRAYSFSKNH